MYCYDVCSAMDVPFVKGVRLTRFPAIICECASQRKFVSHFSQWYKQLSVSAERRDVTRDIEPREAISTFHSKFTGPIIVKLSKLFEIYQVSAKLYFAKIANAR